MNIQNIKIKYNTTMDFKLDSTEVKKDLYKNKSNAIFQYYEIGNLWYRVTVSNAVFDFPVPTVQPSEENLAKFDCTTYDLSSEIGSTQFHTEIKASELNRWIEKSIKNNTYHIISINETTTTA